MCQAVSLVCMPTAPPLPHFTSTNFREHSISNEKVGPAAAARGRAYCPPDVVYVCLFLTLSFKGVLLHQLKQYSLTQQHG